MGNTQLENYPVGQGKLIPVDHTGPASYTTGGETIGTSNSFTGLALLGLSTIDAVLGSGSLSDSGNYWVIVQPTGTGSRKTFNLLWFTASAGVPTFTQVGASVSLSGETVRLVLLGR